MPALLRLPLRSGLFPSHVGVATTVSRTRSALELRGCPYLPTAVGPTCKSKDSGRGHFRSLFSTIDGISGGRQLTRDRWAGWVGLATKFNCYLTVTRRFESEGGPHSNDLGSKLARTGSSLVLSRLLTSNAAHSGWSAELLSHAGGEGMAKSEIP